MTSEQAIQPPQDPSVALSDVIEQIVQHPRFTQSLESWEVGQPIHFDGIWLGCLAPLSAAVRHKSRGPLLVVVAHATDAETVADDLELWSGVECSIFPMASGGSELDSLVQQENVQRIQVVSRLANDQQQIHSSDSSVKCGSQSKPIFISTLTALTQAVPSLQRMMANRRTLAVGNVFNPSDLRLWLAENGYSTTTAVQLPGECTFRGGIVDVFPADTVNPVRIEFFGDEIESIRSFDVVTQKSLERLESFELLNVQQIATDDDASLLDYFPVDAMVACYEPMSALNIAEGTISRLPFPDRFRAPSVVLSDLMRRRFIGASQLSESGYTGELARLPLGDVQRAACELDQLVGMMDALSAGRRHILLICVNVGEVERMRDLLSESEVYRSGRLHFTVAGISSGFEILPDGWIVLSVTQMFRRTQLRRITKKHATRAIDSFLDLRDGDLIVHLAHGIGIYRGLQMLEKHGQKIEHLELEFAEGTKLFVPTTKIDLVHRYVGGTKARPKLAKIGNQSWSKQKAAAKEAVHDLAVEYLELQAQRKSQSGIAFELDSVWQHQFDASFPYEETPDQLSAIDATKKDMERARPMDRLICGDVGFGKTEVAMRAAFKAIQSGYQVAVLVPTTVLAEQHYKTFRERMSEFPCDIARLSRFCSTAEEKDILKRLAKGNIDILIGTHRIASADVQFFNLGLVIIDEEQRFGVKIKESLKQVRPNVDVMTLSATPIPRTLHMSLLGVRDISNLETAPEDRLAVETRVVRFNESLIRQAVLRELNRGGQIYFVHNRISDLHFLGSRLRNIVPEARIQFGHGQMHEHELEKVMVDFIEHRFDMLLSTTIIESGLDIPNANTIFINEANRYGLTELHQLRGRVGRYKHQAHCYLLVEPGRPLTADAARRLHAIEEYSQIGAGFGIAMRDLEIRGAGNLLGNQQSGHIAAVGYELYCQLLENAVRQMTHQPPKFSLDVEIQVPIEAYIPTEYVPDLRHKIDIYRRLTRIDSVQALSDFASEIEDRFGKIPPSVRNLLELAEIRMDAAIWLIRQIGLENEFITLTYTDRRRIEQLAKLHHGKLKVLDQQKAYWPRPENADLMLQELQSILRMKAR